MKNIILASISVFFLATPLQASSVVPQDEISEIVSYMSHLNKNYQRLNVRAKFDLRNDGVRNKTRQDLKNLEDYLQDERDLDEGVLKHVACGRPVCDGGEEI